MNKLGQNNSNIEKPSKKTKLLTSTLAWIWLMANQAIAWEHQDKCENHYSIKYENARRLFDEETVKRIMETKKELDWADKYLWMEIKEDGRFDFSRCKGEWATISIVGPTNSDAKIKIESVD